MSVRPTPLSRRYRQWAGMSLLFLLLLYGRYRWAYATPHLVLPTPTLPSPNAFDVWMQAGQSIRQMSAIEAALRVAEGESRGADGIAKAELVGQNASSLRLVRAGLALSYLHPPVQKGEQATAYQAFQQLARLLVLEGRAQEVAGDLEGACASYLDCIEMGMEIPRGGPIAAAEAGQQCQITGQAEIRRITERLSRSQACAVVQRLERIFTRHVPAVETLRAEQRLGQASLLALFHGETLANAAGQPEYAGGGREELQRLMSRSIWLYGKRGILSHYTRYMDGYIAWAEQPYTSWYRLHLPPDPLNRVLMVLYDNPYFRDVYFSQTQHRLLMTTLALHAYYRDRGGYPTTLAELVPTYLPQVPPDPFAKAGPMQYRLEGESYLLYSVGPDGSDNHGRPYDASDRSASFDPLIRHRPQPDWKNGDVVAGINL